jgi:hypothetical protein
VLTRPPGSPQPSPLLFGLVAGAREEGLVPALRAAAEGLAARSPRRGVLSRVEALMGHALVKVLARLAPPTSSAGRLTSEAVLGAAVLLVPNLVADANQSLALDLLDSVLASEAFRDLQPG